MVKPKIINFAQNGVKTEPSEALQLGGFSPSNDYVLGENLNYLFNNIYENIKFLDFQTASSSRTITADTIASAGERLRVDTTGNIVIVTLPIPTAGDVVHFLDIESNFDINKLVITCQDGAVMGIDEDMNVKIRNISFSLYCIEKSENNFDWRII